MLTKYVALVSEESAIDIGELTSVAAALQKQVTRDFAPLWGTRAVIGAYARLEDVPLDYWPIIIKDDIGEPTAAGYHEDENGQPFALVQYDKDWSLTASHELLEMLGDPFGRHTVAGQSPLKTQGRVKFLVEVCDPCEDGKYAYTVNGITVSDFYTPHFFDPVEATGVRYSFNNSIQKPRQVLKGGYLSWYDPVSRAWWQQTWFGAKSVIKNVSAKLNIVNGNIRAAIDRLTEVDRAKVIHPAKPAARVTSALMAMPAAATGPAFDSNAKALRTAIASVTKPR